MEDRELFLNFISLGRNCEFGIVQKWSEATRLGLLDWLATTPYALLNMLKNGFDGIGEPHQTKVHLSDTEYVIEDTRYRLLGHTWVDPIEVKPDKYFDQVCSRLKFLKRKMLEELKLGESVFVYKINNIPVDPRLMTRIAEQIASFGPGHLLGVFDSRVNGKMDRHVEWAGKNLILAYLEKLAPYESAYEIDLPGWRHICSCALNMVAAARQGLTLPPSALEERANLALHKPALQSSVWEGQGKTLEADAASGNNGSIVGDNGFHTAYEKDPWWQVDLEEIFPIAEVRIFNRIEIPDRCTRMSISRSDDGANWTLEAVKLDDKLFGGADGNPYIFKFDPPIKTRFIRITMIGDGFLHFEEVEVFSSPT